MKARSSQVEQVRYALVEYFHPRGLYHTQATEAIDDVVASWIDSITVEIQTDIYGEIVGDKPSTD